MSNEISINESKQSILLRNARKITSSSIMKGKGFQNFITLDINDPEIAINRMTALDPRYTARFMNMSNIERNLLVPILQISRLRRKNSKEHTSKDEEDNYVEYPIEFTSHFNELYVSLIENPTSSKLFDENSPVSGCGIKRITIEERPENLADINIKATIELVFENAAALLKSNIKELITTPQKLTQEDPLDYRLRLKVGWHVPVDVSNQVIDDDFRRAIEKCNKTYLLELVSHSLSFKMNGKINLTINYQGGIDGFFQSKHADLFDINNFDESDFSTLDIVTKPIAMQYFEEYKKNTKSKESLLEEKENHLKLDQIGARASRLKQIDELIEALDEKIEFETNYLRSHVFSRILRKMYLRNSVFKIDVPKDTYFQQTMSGSLFGQIAEGLLATTLLGNIIPINPTQDFLTTDPVNVELKTVPSVGENGYGTVDTEAQKASNANNLKSQGSAEDIAARTRYTANGHIMSPSEYFTQTSQAGESIPIHFVRLGDIVDAVLSTLPPIDTYKVILGPIKYYNNSTKTMSMLNLGDIPISIDLFNQFFFNATVTKNLPTYYVKNFLEDCIKFLVIPLLGFKTDQGLPLFTNAVPDMVIVSSTKEIKKGSKINEATVRGLFDNATTKKTKAFQYLIISLVWPNPGYLKGSYEDDLKNGIPHFRIGQTSGLLKNVTFEKIDFSEYRSARMVGDKLNKAGQILREQYDCTMELFGNPLMYNGTYFYLESVYFGDISKAAQSILGIGGYYLVNGIETNIQPHKYDMTVKGFWQFNGTDAYQEQNKPVEEGKPQTKIQTKEMSQKTLIEVQKTAKDQGQVAKKIDGIK